MREIRAAADKNASSGSLRQQARAALARIRERAARRKPEPFDWPALKADRDHDRPGASSKQRTNS